MSLRLRHSPNFRQTTPSVTCPTCGRTVRIDATTGVVYRHRPETGRTPICPESGVAHPRALR